MRLIVVLEKKLVPMLFQNVSMMLKHKCSMSLHSYWQKYNHYHSLLLSWFTLKESAGDGALMNIMNSVYRDKKKVTLLHLALMGYISNFALLYELPWLFQHHLKCLWSKPVDINWTKYNQSFLWFSTSLQFRHFLKQSLNSNVKKSLCTLGLFSTCGTGARVDCFPIKIHCYTDIAFLKVKFSTCMMQEENFTFKKVNVCSYI